MKWLNILRKQDRPVRFIVSRIIRNTGLWRFFRIHKNSYSLRLHPASLALSLWVNNNDRESDIALLKALLEPEDIYVDVGANIGQLVVVAGQLVGNKGAVYAFEAHPKIALYLRENVQLNGLQNVKIAQAAVGDKFGWVSFSDQRSDDQNKVVDEGMSIPMLKLEPFFAALDKRVKLLKIDVEGFEKYVLLGAQDSLRKVDFVYFEVMDEHYSNYGYSFEEMFDILSRYDFHLGVVRDGKFIQVSRDDIFTQCVNILAAKDPAYLSKIMKRNW